MPAAQIKKLLDSRNDREILDGLRRVISVRLPLSIRDALLPTQTSGLSQEVSKLILDPR